MKPVKPLLVCLLLAGLVPAALTGCGRSAGEATTYRAALGEPTAETVAPSAQTVPTAAAAPTVIPGDEATATFPATTAVPPTTAAPTLPETAAPAPTLPPAPTETPTESTTKYVPHRTGEMVFTYDPTNKYMKAVIDTYGADPTLLACTYTVPDNNGNLVFAFSGEKRPDGGLLRNADTLTDIYTVNKDLVCRRASLDPAKSEYSESETKLMFYSVTFILDKYEAELSR